MLGALIVCATLLWEWQTTSADLLDKPLRSQKNIEQGNLALSKRGRLLMADAFAERLEPLLRACYYDSVYDYDKQLSYGTYQNDPIVEQNLQSQLKYYSEDIYRGEVFYRTFYACQQRSPSNVRKLPLGSFQSEYILLRNDAYFYEADRGNIEWTISDFSYSVQSSYHGNKLSCVRISRSQEKDKLLAWKYLSHTLDQFLINEEKQPTHSDQIIHSTGLALQQAADKIDFIKMHPVEATYDNLTQRCYFLTIAMELKRGRRYRGDYSVVEYLF